MFVQIVAAGSGIVRRLVVLWRIQSHWSWSLISRRSADSHHSERSADIFAHNYILSFKLNCIVSVAVLARSIWGGALPSPDGERRSASL